MNNFLPVNNYVMAIILVVLGALSFIGSIGCNGTRETTPAEFDKDFRLIFPQTSHVPVIDGLLTVPGTPTVSEDAWNDGFRIELDEGSTVPEAVMHGVADANNIYLYFEIEDSAFDLTDVLIIAFNPSSTDTDYHLLVVYPCPLGGSGCPLDGDSLTPDTAYYTGALSGTVVNWSSAGSAPGVVTSIATAGGSLWSVEVQIPRAAPYNFPASNYFGFYANVVETDITATNPADLATEYTWPLNNPTGDTNIFGAVTDTPNVSVWGNASLSTAIGNGVRIASNDIYTNNDDIATISWNESNTFFAEVHNNTLLSGTLVAAEDVRATFKWANFGLPGYSSFTNIPAATGNPSGYVDIAATGSETYSIEWQASVPDQPFYRDNPHWCIKVELDSTNASTVFYRQSAQVNMDFVETSSPFTGKAIISTKGYELQSDSRVHEFLIEERFYNLDPKLKWQSNIQGVKRITDTNTYLVEVPAKKESVVGLSVLPPDVILPVKRYEVLPGLDGDNKPYVQILVKPGQIITLFSRDAVAQNMRPVNLDPVGGVTIGAGNTAGGLPNEHKPSRNSVLVGSWDSFKETEFVIGNASSYKVPKGSDRLYLKINSQSENETIDKGLNTTVTIVDLENYHIAADSSLIMDMRNNGRVATGSALPTVIYRGKRKTGKTITIKEKTFDVYESVGSFGYVVKGKK